MIAVDTNLLVYAHRPEMPDHDAAKRCLQDVVGSGQRVGFPIHCLVEFSGVVSNRKIWKQPSEWAHIDRQISAWLLAPNCHALTEERTFLPSFIEMLQSGGASGGGVHDARIAACVTYHGVRELWTVDRDFSRYPTIRVRNPLI